MSCFVTDCKTDKVVDSVSLPDFSLLDNSSLSSRDTLLDSSLPARNSSRRTLSRLSDGFFAERIRKTQAIPSDNQDRQDDPEIESLI
jgi:hypothetical protein